MSDATIVTPEDTIKTPFWRQLTYSIGQIAGQVYRDIPSLLLLFFLTNVVGIEPAIAGLAIFIPKLIVGVISDFIVGITSQKNPRAWPKWILAGAILSPIALAVLFRVPEAASNIKVIYVIAIFSFYMAVFSVFSVPYLAIASRLTNDPHQRTVLMAWRLAFTAIGVLISSGAAPAFVANLGGGQPAYQTLGLVLAALCAGALLVAFLGVRGAEAFRPKAADEADTEVVEALSLKNLGKALASPRFSVLLGANLLQLTASGTAYAAFLYYLIYNMKRADAFNVIGILIFISAIGIIVAQPVWVRLSKAFGKKPVFLVAACIHACVCLTWGITGGNIPLYGAFALVFIMGIGNSGWTLLGFSMVTDIASEKSGSIYSAAWVSADKIGFALGGTALIGFILSAYGFSSANAVAGLPQSETAIQGITMAFGFVPATLHFSAALLFGLLGRDK